VVIYYYSENDIIVKKMELIDDESYISPLHLLITYLSAAGGESSCENLHRDIYSIIKVLDKKGYDIDRFDFHGMYKVPSPAILAELAFLQSRLLIELDKEDLSYRFTNLIKEVWNKNSIVKFFKLINKTEITVILLNLSEDIIRERKSTGVIRMQGHNLALSSL